MMPIVTIIIPTHNEYFCFPISYRDVSECEKSVSDSLNTSLMINKGLMPGAKDEKKCSLKKHKRRASFNYCCVPLSLCTTFIS